MPFFAITRQYQCQLCCLLFTLHIFRVRAFLQVRLLNHPVQLELAVLVALVLGAWLPFLETCAAENFSSIREVTSMQICRRCKDTRHRNFRSGQRPPGHKSFVLPRFGGWTAIYLGNCILVLHWLKEGFCPAEIPWVSFIANWEHLFCLSKRGFVGFIRYNQMLKLD